MLSIAKDIIEYDSELEQSIMQEISLEDLYDLPIIEIATGTAVPLEKAPSVATLITAKDIKAMGALTLNEVLTSVPGLYVSLSTSSRLLPTNSFRGLYTSHNPQVLFLLNGHRIIGDLYSGGASFLSRMNIEHISRIEVVRGPGSAVYGADAFAGVINIISKSARELNGFHAGLRAGDNDTQNLWTQYGGNLNEDWEVAFNLEFFSQDSDKSRKVSSDFQTTLDTLFNSSASLAPGHLEDRFDATNYNIHLNNQNWKIGLDGYVLKDSGLGGGTAQALDHEGSDDYEQYLFSVSYNNNNWIDNWQFESQLSYYYSKVKPELNVFPSRALIPIGNDGNAFTPHDGVGCLTLNIPGNGCLTSFTDGYIGKPDVESKIPAIDITAMYEGWDTHKIRFNFGTKKEKMKTSSSKNFGPGVLDRTSLAGNPNPIIVDGTLTDTTGTPYIFAPDKDRTIKYISLQDIWDINANWTLTAGLRYDNYSDFGSTTNPRAALVWTPTDKLITKLLYGEAFRAPSFSELYTQNNPITLGNANLKPETIKTTELAFSYEITPELTTDLNLYHYKTKDMIDFVTNANGSNTAQNDKNLTGKGIELETSWQINKQWLLSANYAYQSTKDDNTHKQVEFVPKQQFYLDARWKFKPDWELSSQLNLIADRERDEADTRNNIKDYSLVNMTLRRKNLSFGSGTSGAGKTNWEFAATIKNLFNENAYEPGDGKIQDDYLLNDRRIYAEIRYHLAP